MIDQLKVAISEKDIDKARRVMISELLTTDYPHEVFRDAIDLADAYGIFETHDKEKLLSDPKDWTESYFQKLKDGLNNNFSKERFMKAYYVARKLEKETGTPKEESCPVSVYDEYKDFFLLAQIGAAVIGAAVVGIGVWLYKRNKKK